MAASEGSQVRPTIDCLRRLLPHLRVGEIAVTGSLAILFHLQEAGRSRPRGVRDLDLVASSPEAVAGSVGAHFLVSHYIAANDRVNETTRVFALTPITGAAGRRPLSKMP